MARTLRLTLLAAVVTAAAASCPSPDWLQLRDKCYWGSDFALSWDDADHLCRTIVAGSDLVSIHDDDVNSFVYYTVLDGWVGWLGLTRASTDDPWTWTDGSPFNYSQFREFESSLHAVTGDYYGPAWAGMVGTDSEHFVCQIAAT